MTVFVTGARGQLGTDLMLELERRGIPSIGIDMDDVDLTDAGAVRGFFAAADFDACIHCAAYTAVDKAEDEPELCRAVNVDGTANVARACAEKNVKMIYISTDYVFDGSGDAPWSVDAPKAPAGVYGKTKSDGEDIALKLVDKLFIVRTSWVFGKHGANFVKTMLRLGAEKETINVVSDQIGSPTFTEDLAVLLCDMVVTEKYGVYHASNEGFCSWYDFAGEIMKRAGLNCQVIPVTSGQYPTKAVRPKNSRLDKSCLDSAGFNRLPDWRDALRRMMEGL